MSFRGNVNIRNQYLWFTRVNFKCFPSQYSCDSILECLVIQLGTETCIVWMCTKMDRSQMSDHLKTRNSLLICFILLFSVTTNVFNSITFIYCDHHSHEFNVETYEISATHCEQMSFLCAAKKIIALDSPEYFHVKIYSIT